MNHWQIIRIVLALCGIFAAGIVTGRYTAPQTPRDPQDHSRGGGPIVVGTGEGLAVNSGQIIRYYTRTLNLTVEQRAQVIPLIRRGMARIQKTQPGSTERMEGIRSLNAEVRPLLTPEQQQTLDSHAAGAEKQWGGRHPAAE
jgi:Spy/CpxP family protein refolding chaperone